jgi:hypothetical protein
MLPLAHYAVLYVTPAGRPFVDTFREVDQDVWIDFLRDRAPSKDGLFTLGTLHPRCDVFSLVNFGPQCWWIATKHIIALLGPTHHCVAVLRREQPVQLHGIDRRSPLSLRL